MTLTSTTTNRRFAVCPRSSAFLWLLLLLVASSNAATDGIFMNVWSDDNSMKQEDCAMIITHPDINEGNPTLVDDAISAVFQTCISKGSSGWYQDFELFHNTGEVADANAGAGDLQRRQRVMVAAVPEDVAEEQDEEEEAEDPNQVERRLPTCPPGCGGWTCGSNCNLCCLVCGQQQYCGGDCQTCRRRLGAPEEQSLFDDEEMRSLAIIKSTHIINVPVAEECRDELQALATKLNALNNKCLGNAISLNKVTPIITL